MIYSRFEKNGVTRRPYKNCNICNYSCWLENSQKPATPDTEEIFETKLTINIREIRESILLKKEIKNDLDSTDMAPIIEFLQQKFLEFQETLNESQASELETLNPQPQKTPNPKTPNPQNPKHQTPISENELRKSEPLGNCLDQFRFSLNNECIALDCLAKFYSLLKLINSDDLNLEKYFNYIIFQTLLKDIKQIKKNLNKHSCTLKYLFDEDL